MLHCPQTLISSSTNTTSLALVESLAGPAWCFTARKPLFLRRRAPRRMGESAFGTGWRGASPPANPCFFVEGHHAIGPGRAFGEAGVVLHRPSALVSSSRGTTSLGPIRLSAGPAWCFTARKPLFLRRGAPRHWARLGFRRNGRGASPPANPCFFVEGHHAPDFHQPDNSGNPPLVPGIPLSQKTKNVGAGAAHATPRRHFPFSPINR